MSNLPWQFDQLYELSLELLSEMDRIDDSEVEEYKQNHQLAMQMLRTRHQLEQVIDILQEDYK